MEGTAGTLENGLGQRDRTAEPVHPLHDGVGFGEAADGNREVTASRHRKGSGSGPVFEQEQIGLGSAAVDAA